MSAQPTKEFLKLKEKFLNGTATPAEIQLMEQYYDLFTDEPDAIEQLSVEEAAALENYLKQRIECRIAKKEKRAVPFYQKTIFRAAAAILVFLSVGAYFITSRKPQQISYSKIHKQDIAPGGNRAVLTLADGSKIVLENSKNGTVSKQGNIIVAKADSQLTYRAVSTAGNKIAFNTIATPKGGQYNLVLSDGTKVKLNAASSLKYPATFTGTERKVELTGEAYFEVAKNKAMPFKVKAAGQVVEVLGTHFNINAYADESTIKTTLLEGSVKVSAGTNIGFLKPGQQASAQTDGSIKITNNVDIDEIMAWKDEMFQFNGADIQTIMRQVARWYDVDVEFRGKLPSDLYRGKISRNVNVSQVLKILELSGINFIIEGRKIIVKA
ncbi:FecR family protein [Mucilaginibacter sp. SP1R1]|uniref:FecR family protein n=1 Tax=Mucilaginibacter sp. SP1R1 TaxID=2723091 RepID=UPI001619B208|nr:FecR family protein [Mucilaginibacter sp. SP1R1]MBB6149345.1 ferric-dicitrate binding protein FerR (iron transport regulator) [Mucilaginibacter sp. SP1R1]